MSRSIIKVDKLPGFWGKIKLRGEDTPSVLSWLPLEDHSLDVALVFRALVSIPALLRVLEASSGQPLKKEQLDRLAVLALLHDVGKANLGFQYKVFDRNAPKAGHIRELAPLLFEDDLSSAFTTAIELETIRTWFDPKEGMDGFFLASWSHHGRPVRFDPDERTGNYSLAKKEWWRPHGRFNPIEVIAHIMSIAREVLPAAFGNEIESIPANSGLQHRFAGLVMLADWLGSYEKFFPIRNDDENRAELARHAALDTLRAVGIDVQAARKTLTSIEVGFEQWFPELTPRPLQAAVDKLDIEEDRNRLLIAESETGSGKTEAALTWFFKLFTSGKVDSLYFALPTRVAARELYSRILEAVRRNFHDGDCPAVVLAVPGYTQVDGHAAHNTLPEESVRTQDDKFIAKREKFWAAERPKRYLAATVGVGTVDQALLSIVQNAHAHLRSVCLDRSLLAVDEVHASDIYMRYLLRALLRHHIKIGGYAMLLSATLGSSARVDFLEATGMKAGLTALDEALRTPYPALTDRVGDARILQSMETQSKKVSFELVPFLFQPSHIIEEVLRALNAGARVIVVMNTVARAISTQRAFEADERFAHEWFFHCNEVACPHHGHFAPEDRLILDKAVSRRFGKSSEAGPLLIIGTQTLEQSLDLDADLFVTDLCPADVLLQRIGRLHRHNRTRPPGFETARCIVLAPETKYLEGFLDGKGEVIKQAKKAGLGSVYEDLRAIELTLRMLDERPEIEIPRDNRWLVEGATHPEKMAVFSTERWKRHGQNVEGISYAGRIQAHAVIIPYDVDFTELVFNELNDRSRTRLGLDNLQFPLDHPVESPFGVMLNEILIPGHIAPAKIEQEKIIILPSSKVKKSIHLSLGERNYHYSRFGLEAE